MKNYFKLFTSHDVWGSFLLYLVGVLLLGSTTYPIRLLLSVLHMVNNTDPAIDPLWHSVRQHFLVGIISAMGVALMVLMLLVTGSYKKTESLDFLVLAAMIFAPYLFDSLMIWARCDNFLDSTKATCPWQTISEFDSDPLRQVIFYATLLALLVIGLGLYRWRISNFDKIGHGKLHDATPSAASP
ncbi:hypothetical protein [Planctomicrobium piriforme]|uniref:Uncharacterized protein n=1 Tax=Planctomicrobium piriforme TaxID=1576369 RepID=A0A1I3NRM1_9PLAN|nr:hypothetical protein [Planctomicrobium piriforme]SFJ11620.1 hypothetical protein SAMN05421753_115171 [Planctomicrobium piriforme]